MSRRIKGLGIRAKSIQLFRARWTPVIQDSKSESLIGMGLLKAKVWEKKLFIYLFLFTVKLLCKLYRLYSMSPGGSIWKTMEMLVPLLYCIVMLLHDWQISNKDVPTKKFKKGIYIWGTYISIWLFHDSVSTLFPLSPRDCWEHCGNHVLWSLLCLQPNPSHSP